MKKLFSISVFFLFAFIISGCVSDLLDENNRKKENASTKISFKELLLSVDSIKQDLDTLSKHLNRLEKSVDELEKKTSKSPDKPAKSYGKKKPVDKEKEEISKAVMEEFSK